MTTNPTPQQAAEQFREEIRAAFDLLHVEIAELRADLAQMREGLSHASQPAPTVGQFGEMTITSILKTIDKNNKVNYMAMGAPYAKFGVRVWDEVLPLLGIAPAALEFGNNIIDPIPARVLLGETTNRETGKKGIGPHKVISKA